MKSHLKFAGAVLLISAATATSVFAADGKWERLGCEQVGKRADFDVVEVGRREGRFSAIRLEAKGNSINVLERF